MENKELYHHGVKGMKWGVRREKPKRVISDDARDAYSLRKKNVAEMSNAELQRLNNRTQLEQNYYRLHPSASKKGIAFMKGAAATMATVLTVYNNSDKIVALGKTVGNKIVDKAGDMVMKDLAKHL